MPDNPPVIDDRDVARAVDGLRDQHPLVHCLTNSVATNWTANVLLAAGAAPAMVDNSNEAEAFARIAGAVLVNLGTPQDDTVAAMYEAVRGCSQSGTPWVLDPVAAGALKWRTCVARELLHFHSPAIIRGNASEITGLSGGEGGRGVDSIATPEDAFPDALKLARDHRCVVAVSGPVDLITDGTRTLTIGNGDPLLTRVTGVGCALGALMAAFCVVTADRLLAAAAATALLTVAAEDAARRSRRPGGFAVHLLDQLDQMSGDQIGDEVRLGRR